MDVRRSTAPHLFTRRQAIILGASGALTAGLALAGRAPLAYAAPSPRLPGEIGRQNGLVSRYAGTVFDHIRVSIDGDAARLFVPQGIVPGSQNVEVLWLHHGAESSDDALIGGFRPMGERGVDLGMVVICQNLGGTRYTHPVAKQHQINGWQYLSGVYGISQNHLRGTSHGGSMGVEVLVTGLIPKVVGSYIVNGVYDLEDLYLNGSARARYSVGEAFGYDLAAIRAHNPARHQGQVWSGKRIRVVYSTPDSSDQTTPPQKHGKALVAAATPFATEVSVRTHTTGHSTPGFADLDNQQTIARWMDEISDPPDPPVLPAPSARWDFAESAAPFAASVAGVAALSQGASSTAVRVATPFGGGIQFNGTSDYLKIPAAQVGALNIGASTGAVTIAAWVFSTDTNNAMIAGCWQEATSAALRSYALFNDLPTYGGDDLVCMHVSKSGGATPGYPHSIDYAADPRRITRGSWQFHVGTYDGSEAIAYLDGSAAPFPSYTDSKGATYSKNPYVYTLGLNATPTDFLVGAGLKNGAPVNLHRGTISRLRVWNTALTAEQIAGLYDAEKGALGT
ncbi:LamG-like jellyroll fold domain-containing protein [Microbacterium sp. NPDC019599]|uniref:LamG-like jellyroll fold domain-containing protein n=1 Tax=Microbacterium sp. NPDC019599 TaxID=3154690 RepID=UPI0033F6D295